MKVFICVGHILMVNYTVIFSINTLPSNKLIHHDCHVFYCTFLLFMVVEDYSELANVPALLC